MVAGNFAIADGFTSRYEGGFANNPKDPGGRTMKGVTQRVYDGWRRRKGLPLRDVKVMEEAERLAIYRGDYWDAVPCDPLPAGVDCYAYDVAVNSGVGRIKPWLAQTAGLAPPERVKALAGKRRAFFQALRTFATFGRGWIARANDLEVKCLKLALGGWSVADASDVFQNEAKASATKAQANTKRAKVSGAGGLTAAGGGTLAHTAPDPTPAAQQMQAIPLEVLLGLGGVLLLVAGVLIVVSLIHKDRAARMAAAA